MRAGVIVALEILVWGALLYWAITRISYVVDDRHLRVILGKFTLRKIALSDIAFVDTAAPLWNEHWCNTVFPGKRVVRIRRRSGWIKNFIITPANRDELIRQIQLRLDTELPL